jgi:3-oxoacyl-[acyl-carrier-protein] synthase II
MKRVVVTGIGLVSPLGNDLSTFWQSLLAGKSGITALSSSDFQDFAHLEHKFGGTVTIPKSVMENLAVFST